MQKKALLLSVLILLTILAGCEVFSGNNKEEIFNYNSLIYKSYSKAFVQREYEKEKIWGGLHTSESDAVTQISTCNDTPNEFCIKVLGAFQFSYSCDTIGPGREWRKGDWVYTAGTEYMGEREYMIAAKGKVFRREYEDAHWHFVFSEEKGVVGIVGLEPRGGEGQLVAHVALRADDEGFGQLAEVCRE